LDFGALVVVQNNQLQGHLSQLPPTNPQIRVQKEIPNHPNQIKQKPKDTLGLYPKPEPFAMGGTAVARGSDKISVNAKG